MTTTAASITDNARSFAEGGDRYTGPEVRLWVYKLCDEIERLHTENASLHKAYAEGRDDQRRDDAKALDALASRLRLGLA